MKERRAYFSKTDYQKASFAQKYVTHDWIEPAILAANAGENLTLEDHPDMREASDDITFLIQSLETNFEYYSKAKVQKPYCRAIFTTFKA